MPTISRPPAEIGVMPWCCAVGPSFAPAIAEDLARTPVRQPMTRHPFSLLFVLVLSASALACSKTYIPNTDVEDTSENRQVVLFCEQYRHALEDKDVSKLLKMMSPAYFEDGGNTKNEDDADYERTREFLTSDFLKTAGIRYEIRYRRVTFTSTNHIFVDYTYAAAWKVPGVKSDEWHHKVADNRLDLVRDGESYKILGGM